MKPEWEYGEPAQAVIADTSGSVRVFTARPRLYRPRRYRWRPERTLAALAMVAASVLGWTLMTWLALVILRWLGVRV